LFISDGVTAPILDLLCHLFYLHLHAIITRRSWMECNVTRTMPCCASDEGHVVWCRASFFHLLYSWIEEEEKRLGMGPQCIKWQLQIYHNLPFCISTIIYDVPAGAQGQVLPSSVTTCMHKREQAALAVHFTGRSVYPPVTSSIKEKSLSPPWPDTSYTSHRPR
jgi:hypothetical protein